MKFENDEVVASRSRRRWKKARKDWKKNNRPGHGELLDLNELAAALGETPRAISNWRHKGLIPCLVLGHRTIRYRLGAVLLALDKREAKRRRVFYEQPV
jgi:hypothetical protein